MNSTVGKFCQRIGYTNTTYVSSAQEIEDLVQNQHAINDFTVLGEKVCEIQTLTPKVESQCRKTNPVIGSFVTALSRIDMHKHIITLKNHGYLPHYTDTDSLIFSGPKMRQVPLPISPKFGHFRKEYENPTGFCCIGKKNYAVSLLDNQNTVLRVRGLSLKAKSMQAAVQFETFKDYLTKNSKEVTLIPQQRLIKERQSFKISRKITHIKLASDLHFNRILTKSANYTTLPYGYVPNDK